MFHFGLTDEQFWSLNWRTYDALSERFNDAKNIADHRAGIIAAQIANLLSKDQVHPYHYFPALKPKPKGWRAIFAQLKAMFPGGPQ